MNAPVREKYEGEVGDREMYGKARAKRGEAMLMTVNTPNRKLTCDEHIG